MSELIGGLRALGRRLGANLRDAAAAPMTRWPSAHGASAAGEASGAEKRAAQDYTRTASSKSLSSGSGVLT